MKWDDDIHNYYEKLVVEHIDALELDKRHDSSFLADLCCMVLNQLPSRYIRHEVDMEFYLSDQERQDMQNKVERAIEREYGELKEKLKGQKSA
ncbi:competence protein ComFB [Aliidiomarina sedimenti]|uniref:Competence protein ComFB n=1 Tax=Aliidiomarina sedimenti TaxID=1933879 RepID=A0ABY0BX92_9GAMM|nr:late competence development ComFB family protein [Aliidiomarina sedimenti]RUO28952.1 competence protein ComFB [Aliidiomarina sedimenti]